MTSRRDFMKGTLAGGIAVAAGAVLAKEPGSNAGTPPDSAGGKGFWPNGAQLVISVSLQFESGGQPEHAESPFPPLDSRYPDTIAPSWYRYGPLEGVPRLLALFDQHGIKVTSHMVGKAVEAYPELAAEVVRRGHEAAGHGLHWSPQYSLTPAEERRQYEQASAIIERVTGQRPVGFNAFWMRHSRETLNILQDLGFLYHIDDLARDEPSITPVRGKPFAVVPYTLRNNDIGRIAGSTAMTGAALLQELKDEFDVLYAEGRQRRRLMSLSAHDRIGGTPTVVHALDQFFAYARSHAGVVFMHKDEIARWALAQADTPINPPRVFV